MNRNKTVLHLFTAHLVNDIYTPVIMAMLPILVSTYGYSYFLAACLASTHSISSSILQPVFGWLSDKKGFTIAVSVSILISGCFISAIGLVPGEYLLMVACVAIAAIGHASFHPAALSIVSDLSTNENRGVMTSYFIVGGNLGFALGPVIAGSVLAIAGFHGIAFLMIPAVIVALLLRSISLRRTSPVRKSPHSLSEETELNSLKPIATLFCASTFRAWVIFGSITFFPLYLVSEGYSVLTATMLVTGMLLAGVLGQVAGGHLSDRYGRKKYLVISTFLAMPFFLLFIMSTGSIAVIAMFLFGFLLWSTFAVSIAMAHEMMPGSIGLTSGLFMGSALGAGGIGVAASGYLADHFGLLTSIALFGILIVLSGFCYTIIQDPKKIPAR